MILLLSSDLELLGPWGTAIAVLSGLAILIKASIDIYKLGWTAFREKWITPRATRKRMLADIKTMCDGFGTTLDRIEAELKTNGGSSVKDVVNQIRRQVTHIEGWQRYQDEASGNASFKLSPDGYLIYASSAFCELLNADEKDLKYMGWVSKARIGEKNVLLRDLKDAVANKMPLDTTCGFNVDGRGFAELRLKAIPSFAGDELTGFFGKADIIP
jgi:hypothetical protein